MKGKRKQRILTERKGDKLNKMKMGEGEETTIKEEEERMPRRRRGNIIYERETQEWKEGEGEITERENEIKVRK